jgi:hypothetical protein
VRLAASQVIERSPAEVFRFVATDHFQNHLKWIRRLPHHQDLPRANGGRDDRAAGSDRPGPPGPRAA